MLSELVSQIGYLLYSQSPIVGEDEVLDILELLFEGRDCL